MIKRAMLASVFAAAVLTLTSCEDVFEDGSLQPDGSVPNLTINYPTNNQVISSTQGLRVNITAVDKDEFKEIDFKVAGGANEAALLDFKKSADKKVLEFDTLVASGSMAPGTYTLSISATDKRTNVAVKQVRFTVK